MNGFEDREKNAELAEEKKYLYDTLNFLKRELGKESGILAEQRGELINANRIMWEETSHRSVTTETAAYLDYFLNTARTAEMTDKQIKKYGSMLSSPYFGRFDFVEDGFDDTEKIYIGYYNLMDTAKPEVYVYDWRAPISSVYYRFELGDCHYMSPQGVIKGKSTLKRQYQIEKGELLFYFDSAIAIRDEILIMALSQNATAQMKNIVETIQKEQDLIIRDMSHNVLIVQGVAGSGKTSVALHRAAYLLYENKQSENELGSNRSKITRDNIIIISPNNVFSGYIDNVLPSLGEETVETASLDSIYREIIGHEGLNIQSKNKWLDSVVSDYDVHRRGRRRERAEYLGSEEFMREITSFAGEYERKIHEFSDITVGGKVIITRGQLKSLFLDNKAKIPAESRLNRISNRVMDAAQPVFDEIYAKYRPLVYDNPKLRFEEERHITSVMAKYRARFEREVKKQLAINIMDIYRKMLSSTQVSAKASKIFAGIAKSLNKGYLPFDAAAGVLYLKLLLCGYRHYSEIKHTIIDEAQDYYPLHYHIFKKLFSNSKFTVLGDINQTIEKDGSGVYDVAGRVLSGEYAFISLSKSYRSSMQIAEFTNKILGAEDSVRNDSVERDGEPPHIHVFSNEEEMAARMHGDILNYSAEGYRQIAVITKTMAQAEQIYKLLLSKDEGLGLEHGLTFALLSPGSKRREKGIIYGVNIMPVYMAKGLEFDAALIYDASDKNYRDRTDRSLLYVACTRALHKLSVYAHEKSSRFLPKP